jgi:hypothetical protein
VPLLPVLLPVLLLLVLQQELLLLLWELRLRRLQEQYIQELLRLDLGHLLQ